MDTETYKEACDRCFADISWVDSAFFCQVGCTYCPECTDDLGHQCPNCSQELVRRPPRTQKVARAKKA